MGFDQRAPVGADTAVTRWQSPALRICLAAALMLPGCFEDRERPGGPTDPVGTPLLSARILEPATGGTVLTGVDVVVRVEARDLTAELLDGAGFVARRVTGGAALVDSAVVRFTARSDTIHEFTLRVPNTYITNTQLDVHAIAFGGGLTRVSEPVHVVVVQCPNGVCP